MNGGAGLAGAHRTQLTAVVVGAGIGGLTAALALGSRGIHVTLLEQSTVIGDVGAGIQLAPNATRVLKEVGAYDALADRAVFPEELTFRKWSDGTIIARRELGASLEQEFGFPYVQVHRADLHEALSGALPSHCTVRLGARVVRVEQEGGSAAAVLADGSRVTGDLLIGADGIHSAVRASVFGADEPAYSGTVSYRALIPAECLAGLDFPDNASWLGPDKHFVHYWVRGRTLLNVVTGVRTERADESWTARMDPAEGLAVFAGWDRRVVGILERVETLFRRGIFTRAPLESWSSGRVALLGDSAHAMVPFHAQGAAQSIMDAAVLASCLALDKPPDEALEQYASLRAASANDVQRRSMEQGFRYHLPDGPESEARDRAMADAERRQRFGALAELWAQDVSAS